jgi:hypothetical protein
VIGRGVGFGAAQEAALKFKETCGLHAEAFSAAEVRHGPMALAKEGFPAFVLSQDDETRAGVKDLVDALAASRADILLAGFDDPRALVPAVAGCPSGAAADPAAAELLSYGRTAFARPRHESRLSAASQQSHRDDLMLTAFVHGRILTDAGFATGRAVLSENGRITAIVAADAMPLQAKIVDLQGGTSAARLHRCAGQRRRRRLVQRCANRGRPSRHCRRPCAIRHHRLDADSHFDRSLRYRKRPLRR